MTIRIAGADLRAALRELELAERRGFTESLAVFQTSSEDYLIPLVDANFSDVWSRSSATDPRQDWGRNREEPVYKDNRVIEGHIFPLYDDDWPTPPAEQFLGGHAVSVVTHGYVIISASLHDIRLRNTLLGLPGDEADRTFVYIDPLPGAGFGNAGPIIRQ